MTAARLADGVRLRRWPGPVPDEPAGLCLVDPGRGYPPTWAGRHEVAGVWLTPLLDDVQVRRAIETYPAPGLVVGGTDDPRWDGGPALTPVAADVQVWDVPVVPTTRCRCPPGAPRYAPSARSPTVS